jgi:hypothetical protein
MMPRTFNKLRPLAVLSCLQKAIRRNEERLAMECAVELMTSSKNYMSMTINRIRIILHEDLDCVNSPHLIPAIELTLQQIETIRHDTTKASKCRMLMGTIIRIMARAPKSREGDHFHVAVGRPVINGCPPELPEWVFDKHTQEGKRQGRGLEHFRTSSCMLIPPQATKDNYEDEAFAIWGAEEAGEPMPFASRIVHREPYDEDPDLLDDC